MVIFFGNFFFFVTQSTIDLSKTFCDQMESKHLTEAHADQIIKNLLFLVRQIEASNGQVRI